MRKTKRFKIKFVEKLQKRILMKQYLLEKSLSQVCNANGIHPAMYYRWVKELLSNTLYTFGKEKEFQEWKNKALEMEKKLTCKNKVLSEPREKDIVPKKASEDCKGLFTHGRFPVILGARVSLVGRYISLPMTQHDNDI